MLEVDFFNNINNPYKWNFRKDIDWKEIENYIDNNIPVLFLTDPSMLNLFDTKIKSAAGHTLTLIGYDEKNVYISDGLKDTILKCTKENLINAIGEPKPVFYEKNIWGPVHPVKINESIEQLIVKGVQRNAYTMLYSKSSSKGIAAIDKLKNEIDHWVDLPNFLGLCSHVYHSIELIGTGGNGFRKLYLNFLIEASNYVRDIANSKLIVIMDKITRQYRTLSRGFYMISKNKQSTNTGDIKEILNNISILEESFWREVETLFPVYEFAKEDIVH